MIISDSLDSVSVKSATELPDVSKSGYYKWLKYSHKPDSNSDKSLKEEIQNIAGGFPGYG